jgi:large subunit ribosomal protein L21
MFAVIKTGGKQYKVAADDVIRIEKIAGEPGEIVEFDEVLMLGGESVTLGSPIVTGATVAGEVVQQSRGAKVIAFKKRRRQNSRRKRGHRQEFSLIRITEILTDGKKPTRAAQAAPAPKPQAAEPAPAAQAAAEAEGEAAKAKAKAPGKPKAPAKAKAAEKKPAKAPAKKAEKPKAGADRGKSKKSKKK